MLISIIIVNYRSTKYIIDCLQSAGPALLENKEIEWIVVDNDSNDDCQSQIGSLFSQVHFLQMDYNAGFARANNAGIKIAKGTHILLLNPDTLLPENSILNCVQRLAASDYVACGVQLVHADYTPQFSGSYFTKGGLNHLLELPYWGKTIKWFANLFEVSKPSFIQVAKEIKVDWVSGAFLMVPLIHIFLKERPSSAGVTPYGAPSDWVEPVQNKTNAARLAIQTLKDASKVRDFWFLVGSFFVCGLSTSGLIGTHFIPAAHDHGMNEVTAASLLALVGVFDVIGTIASGWLTDRYDPRKLLFAYYFLRGLSLFLLPSILFATIHPSTLVFVIFYGLDWVATVPPTVVLCRQILGPEKATVIYGWVFAAHQIGGSAAAFGAEIFHTKFGDYAFAFYLSGLLCIVTAYFVLKISKVKEDAQQ